MLSRFQLLVLLLVFLAPSAGVESAEPDPKLDFFERRIRPALVQHCYECHSAESKELQGELQVDHRAALLRGGSSGPAVVAGKPAESLLLAAIRYESFEMPPKGKLPDHVIRDFEEWISSGAADPREGTTIAPFGIDVEAGREFWSFQAVRRPSIAKVRDNSWPLTPIDHFILASLERKGIPPNATAERDTLVRRLYFDLIGLPPNSRQLKESMSDPSVDAIPRLTERLLASSDFGPHWGRHWLDVVRYADSSGGGRTRILRDAWRYRDYVIDAFNSDLPYDVLLSEQIAGDLLPSSFDEILRRRLTATGFLALGPTNYELQDKEVLRMEVVDEQIDTIGRAFLGMTVGCARCHDHKFDPIPTSDYYALAGILRSTKTLIHANVSDFVERELPVGTEHRAQLAAHARAVATLNSQLTQVQEDLKSIYALSSRTVSSDRLPGIVIDNSQAKLIGDWTASTHTPRFIDDGYQHDGGKGKGMKEATYAASIPHTGEYHVRLSYSAGENRSAKVPVTISHADGRSAVDVDQTKRPPIDGLFVSLGRFRFAAHSTATVNIVNRDTAGVVILDAVQFLPVESPDATAVIAGVERDTAQLKSEIDDIKAELKRLSAKAPPPAPQVMSVTDEEEPGDFRVCIRGNVHNLGENVPRGFLRAADRVDRWDIPAGESGRREFADWLTDPRNPLVARVMVNRIWRHLMGTGLVRTPDNFGSTGERPSHPELLDYLAHELVRHDWSVKAIVRQIVNSRVYQLASDDQPQAVALDPENRLYWRSERKRLTAEQMRDAILICSDTLDRRQGGPSVDAGVNSEFNYEFAGNRRGAYVPIFRNTLMDLLEVFDVADPNLVVGRRNVSTRPTQALFLMNSPFVVRQAEHLAWKMERLPFARQQDRINWLFIRTLGRPATDTESKLTLGVVDRLCEHGQSQEAAWTAVVQSLFACVDFRYVR